MIYDATIQLPNGEQQTLEVIAPDEHEAHHMINQILETLNEETNQPGLDD